jgi:hypothetical protein
LIQGGTVLQVDLAWALLRNFVEHDRPTFIGSIMRVDVTCLGSRNSQLYPLPGRVYSRPRPVARKGVG